jgi:hypothetical protein
MFNVNHEIQIIQVTLEATDIDYALLNLTPILGLS